MKQNSFHHTNHLATEVENNIILELCDKFRETMSMLSSNAPQLTQENHIHSSPTFSLSHTSNSVESTNDLLQVVIRLQQQLLNILKPTENNRKHRRYYFQNQIDKHCCWT